MTRFVFLAAAACIVLQLLECTSTHGNERQQLIDQLIEKLESPDWQVRMAGAAGLGGGGLDARHALPALWKARFDKHEKVRHWADRSAQKIYASLKTQVPLEQLVKEIAAGPNPPHWNRIPAHVPRGRNLNDGLKDSGLQFSAIPAFNTESVFTGGWLGIKIPLAYTSRTHSRFVGKTVVLGKDAGLDVDLNRDYVPKLWEEREIIACKELEGEFGKLDLPALPQGLKWIVVYDDLKGGFDLDRDGRADVTLRVAPTNYRMNR